MGYSGLLWFWPDSQSGAEGEVDLFGTVPGLTQKSIDHAAREQKRLTAWLERLRNVLYMKSTTTYLTQRTFPLIFIPRIECYDIDTSLKRSVGSEVKAALQVWHSNHVAGWGWLKGSIFFMMYVLLSFEMGYLSHGSAGIYFCLPLSVETLFLAQFPSDSAFRK